VRIFVGNLPFEAQKEELQALFEKQGTVQYTTIATDSEGKEPGFAFVAMESLRRKRRSPRCTERPGMGGCWR
jgi:RNA recognition motif-containing protein